MKKKSKLNEFFIAGGVVSRKAFDSRLDTPVRGSGVKLSSLVKEGNPESWDEGGQGDRSHFQCGKDSLQISSPMEIEPCFVRHVGDVHSIAF